MGSALLQGSRTGTGKLRCVGNFVSHLDDNRAAELVSGTLSAKELALAETHLAGCRDCRALVAALASDPPDDSDAATAPVDKLTPSQVGSQGGQLRPVRVFAVGDRVGRYLVLSTLGAGGMGVVFSAYDPQLDRKVALKLLRAGTRINSKDARARLRREAQAIAQLSHPNVVAAYDVGATDDGDLYIAMEFVEGDTLTKWLKAYPRTWREIIDVFLQAARGLVAAHSVGLLHRDFKPDNVLVGGDGRVRVTDFGLARSVLAPDDGVKGGGDTATLNADLTATGTVLGTPRYMAPEQQYGPDIDARADQFSFCVALYEALYGSHPLPGASSVSMLESNEKAAAPPEAARVPSSIGRAVMRGLERERAKRFPTMAALISELVPPPPRAPVRLAVIVAGGVALVGTAVAAMVMTRPTTERERPLSTDIGPLIEQLNRLEAEKNALRKALESRPTIEQIQELMKAISVKDEKIKQLAEQIIALTDQANPPPKPAVKPEPSIDERSTQALEQVHFDLEGCFKEWHERVGGGDIMADLRIQVSVGRDGKATDTVPIKFPDEVLRFCVTANVERVQYPTSDLLLTLRVDVGWRAGLLTTAARVVGRFEPTDYRPDL